MYIICVHALTMLNYGHNDVNCQDTSKIPTILLCNQG